MALTHVIVVRFHTPEPLDLCKEKWYYSPASILLERKGGIMFVTHFMPWQKSSRIVEAKREKAMKALKGMPPLPAVIPDALKFTDTGFRFPNRVQGLRRIHYKARKGTLPHVEQLLWLSSVSVNEQEQMLLLALEPRIAVLKKEIATTYPELDDETVTFFAEDWAMLELRKRVYEDDSMMKEYGYA
jgi:hypothetical protein